MSSYKFKEKKDMPVVVNGEAVEPGKKVKASTKAIDIAALIKEKRESSK